MVIRELESSEKVGGISLGIPVARFDMSGSVASCTQSRRLHPRRTICSFGRPSEQCPVYSQSSRFTLT